VFERFTNRALLRQEDGVAVSALESLHADRHDLRVRVENLTAGHPPDHPGDPEDDGLGSTSSRAFCSAWTNSPMSSLWCRMC
jgi:hypothetical protein